MKRHPVQRIARTPTRNHEAMRKSESFGMRCARIPRVWTEALPAGAAVGLVLALAGCVTDVEPPRQTIWEATLSSGLEHPDAGGTAAAVSGSSLTQASVSVGGLAAGTYRWGVLEGQCTDPGEILGSEDLYPALSVGIDGQATSDAAVNRHMRAGNRYFAQVWTADGVSAACGDFERWD
jgi:hypothetical protein